MRDIRDDVVVVPAEGHTHVLHAAAAARGRNALATQVIPIFRPHLVVVSHNGMRR